MTNIVSVSILAGDSSNDPTGMTFTTDLTQLGRNGRLRQTPNFEKEIDQVLEVLAKGESRQPVIVDQNGNAQDEIVEQIAIRIAKGNVAESLRAKSVIKLETGKLVSRTNSEAELNLIVGAVLEDAVASKGQKIIFVEDLPYYLKSSASAGSLVKLLTESKLTVIGSSSVVDYTTRISSNKDLDALFAQILVASNDTESAASNDDADRAPRSYRGDNVSPDIRDMMNEDPTGKKRIDVIVQAKDADNQSFRALIDSGNATIVDRIGRSENLVVNMSLATVQTLSTSGLVNYMSPDREVKMKGHLENTTGTTQVRSQSAGYGRSQAYTLDGAGVGIAVVDSGIAPGLKSFNDGQGNSRGGF